MPLLPRLLKTFYRTGLPYLPVVSVPGAEDADGASAAGTARLILSGFLSRSRVDRLMADLDRARLEYDHIPDDLLVRDYVPEGALKFSGPQVPVFDAAGQQLANWDEPQLLKAVAEFRERLKSAGNEPHFEKNTRPGLDTDAVPENAPIVQDRSDAARWLGELLLAALPYALFATDLQGNTLFYNERFAERILAKGPLKNSIRLAESYFTELTRTLLARSFERDPMRELRDRLSAYSTELGLRIRVLNLEDEGRIHGYLYLFHDTGESELFHELEDRNAQGQGLEDILEDVEGQFIHLMLTKHGQNVSHTAKALKIKRSTLQNKIKRLDIDNKYGRRIEGPIRRRRRTARELERLRKAEEEQKAAGFSELTRRETEAAPEKTESVAPPKDLSRTAAANLQRAVAGRKAGAKKAVKKAAKQVAKKTAKKTAKKSAKKPAAKAAQKSARKAAKKAAQKTARKAAKKSNRATKKKRS